MLGVLNDYALYKSTHSLTLWSRSVLGIKGRVRQQARYQSRGSIGLDSRRVCYLIALTHMSEHNPWSDICPRHLPPPLKTILVDIEQVRRADVCSCDFRGMVSVKGANVPAFWLILEHCPRYHIWRPTSRERDWLDTSNFLSWIRVLSWTERSINIRSIAKPSGAGSPLKSGKNSTLSFFAKLEDFSSSRPCHSRTRLLMSMNVASFAAPVL